MSEKFIMILYCKSVSMWTMQNGIILKSSLSTGQGDYAYDMLPYFTEHVLTMKYCALCKCSQNHRVL